MTCYTTIDTPIGQLIAVGSDAHLQSLYWATYKRAHIDPQWQENVAVFSRLSRELTEYFAGSRTTFSLPDPAPGTPFQRKVWQVIAAIPPGTTATYKDIAAHVGHPQAVRAVGTAVGSNPFSILVPCHRVMASSGGLGGYAGGLAAKQYLLHLEHIPHDCRCNLLP